MLEKEIETVVAKPEVWGLLYELKSGVIIQKLVANTEAGILAFNSAERGAFVFSVKDIEIKPEHRVVGNKLKLMAE